MGEPGIEPGPPNGEGILSPPRLPVPPLALSRRMILKGESRKPSWQWKRIGNQNQIPEVRKKASSPHLETKKKYRKFPTHFETAGINLRDSHNQRNNSSPDNGSDQSLANADWGDQRWQEHSNSWYPDSNKRQT